MDPTPDAPAPMAREAWVHHQLTRATDLPIVAAGELSGRHVWGLALGAGRRGLEGHLALGWLSGGGRRAEGAWRAGQAPAPPGQDGSDASAEDEAEPAEGEQRRRPFQVDADRVSADREPGAA